MPKSIEAEKINNAATVRGAKIINEYMDREGAGASPFYCAARAIRDMLHAYCSEELEAEDLLREAKGMYVRELDAAHPKEENADGQQANAKDGQCQNR